MLKYDINNVKFVTTGNTEGLSTTDTVFHYFLTENTITGSYSGGSIVDGQIIGKVLNENTIQLLFQCLTTDDELLSGQSVGTIDQNHDNLLTISFDWSWLNGDKSGGVSNYIQKR